MAFKRSWVRSPPSPPIKNTKPFGFVFFIFLIIWGSNPRGFRRKKRAGVRVFRRNWRGFSAEPLVREADCDPHRLHQQKENFCLPKVLFLFIQAAGLAYHHDAVADIIKGGSPPLYLITHQRASYLRLDDIQPYGLMIYRNKLRMIYTPSA